MLLIIRCMDLWKRFLPQVRLINCRFHFFDLQLPPFALNIFSCFTNHQGAVFFFSLLLSLPSFLIQCHHEGGIFLSEYDQPNWLFYVGYYLEVSSWLLCVQEFLHRIMFLIIYILHYEFESTKFISWKKWE